MSERRLSNEDATTRAEDSSWLRRCLAAIDCREIAINLRGHVVLYEPHRAVGIGKLQSIRVPAAEGIEERPIVVRIVKCAVRLLVPIWRHRSCSADTVGIRPRAVGVDRRNVLAEHE